MNHSIWETGTLCLLTGFGFYIYGSTKYRLPHAPIAFNGPRGWPWQHHDWFAPRGVRYRKIGLGFEAAALAFWVLAWVV